MNIGALAIFAFVSSITPGPNNIMLWGSGMNFGFRRTTPHLFGVNLGFASLTLVTNLGLGTIFVEFPIINTLLKVLGSTYLLYLAYKVATSSAVSEGDSASAPLTFTQAAAFQYVNPKAWVMGATAAASFLPNEQSILLEASTLAGIFVAVNLPCITTWAAAGTAIGKLLTSEKRRRIVNGVLGLLLVGTVFMINQ